MHLSGAVIALFGAGHGIGAVLCAQLRERGATVLACARHAQQNVASVDVCDPHAVLAFLQDGVRQYGKIDAVVNCAGIAGERMPLETLTPEAFASIMSVNVHGTFHVLRAAVPLLREHGGMVITLASRAGHRAYPSLAAYSASKAATIMLHQGMAKELQDAGSSVVCCTVSPGGVHTRMRTALFGEADSTQQLSPDTVAATILRLLTGDLPVTQGADVVISREATDVRPMV